MLWYLVAMVIVLAVAAGVVGAVVVGIEGRYRDRFAPKLVKQLERAGRHLSGEGELPKQFSRLFH